MSTKKDLKTGAIFEIELDKGIGFGYIKLLLTRDIDASIRHVDFIVKPYNVYSERSLKKGFNPADFETDDLICFPLLMYYRPPLRGQDSWNFIGLSKLTEEDLTIPDYVEPGFELSIDDNLKKAFELDKDFKVYYVKNLKNQRELVRSYESIKHLGYLPVTYPNSINRFLTIYWLQKNGGNFLDFYKEYKTGESYYERKPFDAIGLGILMHKNLNLEFLKLPKATRLKYYTKE